jgi:hypothetical protein
MSVYYLKGTSNYGDSAGVFGYYYPLYTSSDDIVGQYHQHTFEGLDGVVFYMPIGSMNHGTSGPPTASAYNNEMYSEYATYNFDSTTNIISYTNRPEASLVVSSVAQYSPKQTSPYNERTSNKESSAVDDLIPLQLRESAETLTALLEDYYTYLNTNDQVLNISKRILTEHDIDETSSDYLKKIQQEVAVSVPDSRVIDTVSLYKRIVNYYSVRGSEESVLVFFKLFFDEIVEVLYPKDFLLKASDGDWIQDDDIFNYGNTLAGSASNSLLGVDDIGTPLKFYNSSDGEIGTGQIQRLEKIDNTNLIHPDTQYLFLEIDTSERDRYDPDENSFRVYDAHSERFSQTVAQLKNGAIYSEEDGFIFTDSPGGNTYDRNHVDLGQIYKTNPEILTEADDTLSHTMIAHIKADAGLNGPAHLFVDETNYPGLKLDLQQGKLNYETWRWGTGNGYNPVSASSTTDVPTNGDYATVAVRGRRDIDAIADAGNVAGAAAGDGYIDVSVNGETWERVWDDSDYGTPTSFDIKRAGVYYDSEDGGLLTTQIDINGFTKAGTSSNGSDYYEADFADAVITGNSTNSWANSITTDGSGNDFDKYVIEYMTAAEIRAFYTGNNFDITQSWNEVLEGFDVDLAATPPAYGMWILIGQASGYEGKLFPLQIWFDATSHAVFEVINNRSSGIMHKLAAHQLYEYADANPTLPNDIYDGAAQVVRSHASNSLNNSGSQRTSFYQTLIDYEKRMKVLAGYGSTNNGSLYRHTYSPFQLNEAGSSAASRSEDVALQSPQISSQNWVTYGKQITAVTTKEMLDVNDSNGSLRLGVRRSIHYFKGNIKYFAYYQKEVTNEKIGEIHDYLVKKLNPYQWAMRVNVDENRSLSSLYYLRDSAQTYTFSNITGPLKDSFWSYESSANNVLSDLSVTYQQANKRGKVTFGDRSPSLDFISGNKISHTFNETLSSSGKYADRKGFISDINKVQDSNFWSDYSYQIRGDIQLTEWESEYLRLVHPAGMKMFSALLMQISRSNSWLGDTSYKVDNDIETDDLKLTDWLEKLIPPWKNLSEDQRRLNDEGSGSMHMPFYQPGWLDVDIRGLFILIQALVNGNNPRSGGGIYERSIFLILRFIFGADAEGREQKVDHEYKRWIKWFDKHTRVADYGDLTVDEINSEKSIVLPSQHKETNLLNAFLPWSPGNGDDEKYGAADGKKWKRNGDILENFREYIVTPFGSSTIGWIGTSAHVDNPGRTLPLDVDNSAALAFSLRNLSSSYTGEVVEVRRSSDGSVNAFTAADVADGTLVDFVGGANLVRNSQNFDDSSWGRLGLDESQWSNVAATTAPDGTNTAYEIKEDDSFSRHRLFQYSIDLLREEGTMRLTLGKTYTFSCYVKKKSDNRFLFINGGHAIGTNVSVNLDTMETSNNSATVTSVGNEWYRVSMTGTCILQTGVSAVFYQIQDVFNRDEEYQGVGSSFYLWGAQIVEGSLPGDYTETGSSISGEGYVSKWYDQSGNNNHARGDGRYQPKVVSNGALITRSGSPSIRSGNNTSTFLDLPEFSLSADGQQSLFAVVENNVTPAAGTYPAVFRLYSTTDQTAHGGHGANRRPHWFISPSTTNISLSVDSHGGTYMTSKDRVTVSHIMNGTDGQSNGTSTSHVDGVQIGSRTITLDDEPNAASLRSARRMLETQADSAGELYMSELIYYTSDQTSNRAAIETGLSNLNLPVTPNAGFSSPLVGITTGDNNTKTYRCSVWMKQESNSGKKIFEVYANNGGNTSGLVRLNSPFTVTSEISGEYDPASFWTGDLPENNKWFLLVGYIRPDDGTRGAASSGSTLGAELGGIYNTVGEKIISGTNEFMYQTTAEGIGISAGLFSIKSEPNDQIEIFGTRIEAVDGTEPSIEELLHPTIEPNVFYNIDDRPANRKVKKFNNVSTNAIYIQPTSVHTITTNDYDHRARNNYNENLKFFDNSRIGAYYNTAISDMVTVTEEGYISNDTTYLSAGNYSSSVSEYTPPATNNNAGQGGQTGGQGGY